MIARASQLFLPTLREPPADAEAASHRLLVRGAFLPSVAGITNASAVEKASGQSVLTVRELDILKWIYLGKSNFEIGAILKISPLTVKNHVQKILRKLNVVNRTQAIGKALELRILNP